MSTATDRQMAFRSELIQQRLADAVRTHNDAYGIKGRGQTAFIESMLILSLPAPVTAAEASEQIDALKPGMILGYARSHAGWAQPIIDRYVARYGEDKPVIETPIEQHGHVTLDQYVAAVREVLA